MFRLCSTFLISFLLGVVFHNAITQAADTKIKTRREQAPNFTVRKSQQKTVVKREEILGSILKLSHHAGKSYCWISLRGEDGRSIQQLTADNFQVTETVNGITRHIPPEAIALEDKPLLSVLLRDTSGSMSLTDLRNSKRAIASYIAQMRPDDKTALIFFSSHVSVVQTFSSETKVLQAALKTPFDRSSTRFYDAITLAVQELRAREEVAFQSVIVALTDGEDSGSTASLDDVLKLLSSNASPVFAVGIGGANRDTLKKIATQSGGLYFYAKTTTVLDSIYEDIRHILRGSYVLSFPTEAKPGDAAEVEIEIETSSKKDRKRVARFFGKHVIR